jgi:sarcosine oxidase, subunit gamma
MSELLYRCSPLSEYVANTRGRTDANGLGLSLIERPFLGHLNLRGNPEDRAFLDATRRCLGVPLPLKPNTVTENDAVTTLWLRPDEWLVVTEPLKKDELAGALDDALHGILFAVTDVTDGQTIVRISGAHAIDVLRKGCSLDVDPDVFRAGQCAQTLIAKVGVLIRCLDNSPAFDLIVRRSFSEYLVGWLEDAALEYGLE